MSAARPPEGIGYALTLALAGGILLMKIRYGQPRGPGQITSARGSG